MLIKILKFMRGYLKIRLEGYSPERFLNLCCNHNILLWNLENHGNAYEMYISVKGFRQLKPIIRKTRTKVTILGRYGMPFFLHKYRKRKMFFFGIMLSGCIIYGLSLFIWDIQVEGNYSRTTEVLLDFLETESIYHGVFKREVNCQEIEELIRNEYEDIIWASVEMKGTRLIVHVQESLDVEATGGDESDEPTDLRAGKDGIITEIITRAGTPLVSIGDVVKQGDVLVHGRMEIIDDNGVVANYQYCNADADILIKTVYNYQDSFPLIYIEKTYSGNQEKEYYVKAFSRKFGLNFAKNKFTEYDTVSEEQQLHFWDNFYLPFYFGVVKREEYESVEKKYNEEEANQLANDRLEEFCEDLRKKGIEILENNVTIQMDEMTCSVSGKVQVIEKTGERTQTEIIEIQPIQEEENIDEHNGNDS